MSALMYATRLLVTDPQFQGAYETGPAAALAQRGLTLGGAELQALSRVWVSVREHLGAGTLFHQNDSGILPIEDPDYPQWW